MKAITVSSSDLKPLALVVVCFPSRARVHARACACAGRSLHTVHGSVCASQKQQRRRSCFGFGSGFRLPSSGAVTRPVREPRKVLVFPLDPKNPAHLTPFPVQGVLTGCLTRTPTVRAPCDNTHSVTATPESRPNLVSPAFVFVCLLGSLPGQRCPAVLRIMKFGAAWRAEKSQSTSLDCGGIGARGACIGVIS